MLGEGPPGRAHPAPSCPPPAELTHLPGPSFRTRPPPSQAPGSEPARVLCGDAAHLPPEFYQNKPEGWQEMEFGWQNVGDFKAGSLLCNSLPSCIGLKNSIIKRY